MGSGKTYEVVSVVILEALRSGRRVVSNIAGLNADIMRDFLIAQGCENPGEVVHVDHVAVKKPDFWLTDTGAAAFLQPGDLLALDEVWRFWEGLGPGPRDDRRPASVMNFIRMHRQFIHHETGVSCDMVIITQDVSDIHRSVKAVVEQTHLMTKLKMVGRSDKYRIDIFTKGRTTGKPLRQLFGTYEPEKFAFYKSHAMAVAGGADPRELESDGRGNVLKSKFFKVLIFAVPLLVILGGVAVFWSWDKMGEGAKLVPTAGAAKPAAIGAAIPAAQGVRDAQSSDYRIVGIYTVGHTVRAVLSDGQNTRYVVDPRSIKRTALTVELELPDGAIVTSWQAHVKYDRGSK